MNPHATILPSPSRTATLGSPKSVSSCLLILVRLCTNLTSSFVLTRSHTNPSSSLITLSNPPSSFSDDDDDDDDDTNASVRNNHF
ncbi:hypothetical protein NEUTE2DRAFT_122885 [Neurospora tetrasperma FGSC 2509]|nr:hypothetical protein NEUTE2DRAFT_122885 [Neurospora tetrasperma FGSC 2509]